MGSIIVGILVGIVAHVSHVKKMTLLAPLRTHPFYQFSGTTLTGVDVNVFVCITITFLKSLQSQ